MKAEETGSLKERWEALLKEQPRLRIRDAARLLGVGEAQLLATDCAGHVTRLEGDWSQLITKFPRLGRVMCLTRNEHAVHERYGEFRQIEFFSGMGQVVGPDIDLRLFMRAWRLGFAVTDFAPDGERLSFQFFDATGDAIHKVYLQDPVNRDAFEELVRGFRSPDQDPGQNVAKRPGAASELRLAPEGYARKVETTSTRRMLESYECGRFSTHGMPLRSSTIRRIPLWPRLA